MLKVRLALGPRSFFVLAVAILVLGLDVSTLPVRADELLVVPDVRQTFWPPEFTGQTYDRGAFDCVPASISMVLQTFQSDGRLGARVATDYPTVRHAFRQRVPNARIGITPDAAARLVPVLSRGALGATVIQASPATWQETLDAELTARRPFVAIIDDWNLLTAHWSPPGLVHAIVVTGLQDGDVFYNDPWDGKSYWITDAAFADAWGNGANAWIGVSVYPSS